MHLLESAFVPLYGPASLKTHSDPRGLGFSLRAGRGRLCVKGGRAGRATLSLGGQPCKEALPACLSTSCWWAAPVFGAVLCQEAPVWDHRVCSRVP